ncbi:hypothetical protein ACFW1A_04595 [Kitasatospora sp. NPDC058965]|uniref:hypothetical protein n=1 Tax=Kitasatospora sp. NPDC058965 TaxID=3346682 RepID=UPI00368A2C15
MNSRKNAPANAACVEKATANSGPRVPASETVVVVVVLLLAAALIVNGMPARTAITTLTVAGTLGVELARRLAAAPAVRRAC